MKLLKYTLVCFVYHPFYCLIATNMFTVDDISLRNYSLVFIVNE